MVASVMRLDRLGAVCLIAISIAGACGYGDTTDAERPANASEACALTCARIEALQCKPPLSAAVIDACRDDCAAFEASPRFAICDEALRAYFECQSRQGNVRCAGSSFEYVDECSVRSETARACLENRSPNTGLCPEQAPVDCGNGFCCPSTHPECVEGGLCAVGAGGGGG